MEEFCGVPLDNLFRRQWREEYKKSKEFGDIDKTLDAAMSCIETMGSCLTYGSLFLGYYSDRHEERLGTDVVRELFDEYQKWFKEHVTIKRNVYVDGEYVSYHSVIEH